MKWTLGKTLTLIIMIPLVSAYSFSLDLYNPLIPTIQTSLQISRSDIQLTNSLFMLFCGVGQLVFGPLSDRFGRRSILFLSLSISIIANLICMRTMVYSFFLAGKCLQAIGACGAYLTCFATIRDLYHQPEKSAEMFSYLNIANSTSAIIAPSIGTQLGKFFGWQSIFFTLMLYALFSIISCFFLYGETSPKQKKTSQKHQIIYDYWMIFSHVNYQVYTLPAALGMSSFFAYFSISPYLYLQTFALSKEIYSLLFGSCGLTFFIGSYVCGKLVNRIGIIKTLLIGQACHFIGCIGLIASFVITTSFQLTFMHLSIICIIWGAALMVSSGIGGTMAPFQSIAGSAFALISAYKFSLCYILGEITMGMYDNTAIPLGVLLLSINVFSLIVLFLFSHRLKSQSGIPESTENAISMSKTTDNIL